MDEAQAKYNATGATFESVNLSEEGETPGRKSGSVGTERNSITFGTVWAVYKQASLGLFDILVIDEGSEMPTAHGLIAASLLKSSGRLVCAGDLLQLPPIQNTELLSESTPDEKPFVTSVMQALLSRTHGGEVERVRSASDVLNGEWPNIKMLTVSYRSTKTIAQFIGRLYKGQLEPCKSPPERLEILAKVAQRWSLNDALRNFFDSDLATLQDVPYAKEAEAIANVVAKCRTAYNSEGVKMKTVCVVTPHRRQRDAVRQAIAKTSPKGTLPEDVVVDTTERMQGDQADVVIMALAAVSNASTFIFDLCRLNVAFSRARKKVILACSSSMLQPSNVSHVLDSHDGRLAWQHFLDYVAQSSQAKYSEMMNIKE